MSAAGSTNGGFGALHGLKVLDLTLMLAGPYATQILADQGADVIKIESPKGDMTRGTGPFLPDDVDRLFGGYFSSINRNKRSIVIDLKTAEGRDIFKELVKSADVIVENFRAGVMDRLGLPYEELQVINPKLVYATVRGFGDPRTAKSPYVDWPAFDVVSQAMGGIMGVTGPDAGTPVKVGPGIGDIVPAMFCTIGILAAVMRARETGQGQFVDVAMADGILAICERIVYQYSYLGVTAKPEGNHHPFLVPFGMYPVKDGAVAIACPNDNFWKVLCEKLGMAEALDDPRFASIDERLHNRQAVIDAVSARTCEKTKHELTDLLGGFVPFGPVYDMGDIVEDPHFKAREMIVDVECPGLATPIKIAGTPIRMTQTQGGIRRPPPMLGEHTDEVLGEAGFDAARIAEWHRRGILK